jgi:imidazolonepropionase-like amidohydrolase
LKLNTIAAITLLLSAPLVFAQDAVVHVGTLYTRVDQPALKNRSVIIDDGKIREIRTGLIALADAKLDSSAKLIDWSQDVVLPGLIDCHVHLASDAGGVQAQLNQLTMSPAAQAYEAAVNARKTLAAGFTTVRNLGDADGVTLALRDAIAAGKVPGPRILDAGNSISATTGHMDAALGYRSELREAINTKQNLCDGADACRKAVRLQVARGVDVIKFATTGGVNSRIGLGLGAQMFEDEARAIIETAHLYGKRVAVHAHGADGINLALRFGADSIEHGTLLDKAGLKLFASSGAYYVPTLSTINGYIERLQNDPNAYSAAVKRKIEWRIAITGKALELAHKAGVKIAFGTDAGVSLHGRNADEFELMVKFGMSPTEALMAATVNAADLLGLSDEIGTIEVGKSADLIALPGDPLLDLSLLKRVRAVIQAGRQ